MALLARCALLVSALALAGLLLVGCQDDEVEPEPPILEVSVADGGLAPRRVEVRAPDRYQLVVHNEMAQECLFNLGTYVRDLVVGPGETEQIHFQISPTEPEGQQVMGCSGLPEVTGDVIVRTGTALN